MQRTLAAAWDLGIRLFDAAPSYGHGQSAHRVGNHLRHCDLADTVVATNVGKLQQRPAAGGENADPAEWRRPAIPAALGEGGLLVGKDRFAVDAGVEYVGPGGYDVDYLCAGEAVGDGLVRSPFLCYEAGLRTTPAAGAEVLARIREPHFSRTYGAYCGHLNTPYGPADAAHPGAVRTGNRVFLAHHLGRIYHAHGARVHRQMFRNALALAYPTPTATTVMPSAGRLSLLHQPQHRRYVAHLLYAPPMQRGRCLVIEDLVPLYNVPLRLTVPEQVTTADLAPQGDALEVQRSGDSAAVIVPEVYCHQAVVFGY